ncbi:MAG: STAS domain-containing protein [Planctomycetota bacterium]
MKLSYEDKGPVTVFSIDGDLSVEEADRFQREALQRMDQDVRDFVLDLESLDFIDSRGLEALLWLQEKCNELLGQVRLAACPEHIYKVLEVTRLSTRFESHPDVDTAVGSLGHGDLA